MKKRIKTTKPKSILKSARLSPLLLAVGAAIVLAFAVVASAHQPKSNALVPCDKGVNCGPPSAGPPTPSGSPNPSPTPPGPNPTSGSGVAAGGSSTECKLTKPFFFFFPPWWEYLQGTHIDYPNQCIPTFKFPDDVAAVLLAAIDMLLRLAGFVAAIAIIISGAQFVFSGGNPERAVNARWRMYNALIGLAIVSVATAVVTFIGKQLS